MNNAKPKTDPKPKTGIQISNWKSTERNTLRAYFSATLPSGLILHNLSLHERSDGRWINYPSRETTDEDGNTQYVPLISFIDADTKYTFRDAVLEAIEQQKPWEKQS